ncbi:lens fiber major intrinsic protein-like [Engraulis encrasicolus]|uniref:lens fiber major intrinsic protein-like n=1 Tax=Engraulis encrasicolus TaxID=184585 RepID=UPI002FCF01A4
MAGRIDAWIPWPLASVTIAHPMRMFHTGAEMNPARSFTPAMFKRNFMNHWVMYDFMLFFCMCGLAEWVATLKGS